MILLSLFHKYYYIFKDFLLNLIGNILIIAITQLIVFPLLSKTFSSNVFGSITSVYGINSIILAFTGNSLANVRLIYDNKDGNNFNILSLFYSFLFSLIISIVLFNIYGHNLTQFNKVIFSLTTSLMSLLEYGISIYRVRLRYKLYLYQNILISFGYIIGIIIFQFVHIWSLIFLIGNGLGIIFFVITSGVLHETIKFTSSIKYVVKQLLNISMGDILDSTTSNLDRLLIPVILNVSYLPIFFSANTLAKMFSLIMGPLSSVLLSHLSKLHVKWKRYKLNKLTFILILIGILLILPSYLITILLMKILYGSIYYNTLHIYLIILFSCVATSLFEVWNILNVIYLICLKSKFQVFINLVFLICYLLFSSILSLKLKLVGYSLGYALAIVVGFCFSIIISNIKFFWKREDNG